MVLQFSTTLNPVSAMPNFTTQTSTPPTLLGTQGLPTTQTAPIQNLSQNLNSQSNQLALTPGQYGTTAPVNTSPTSIAAPISGPQTYTTPSGAVVNAQGQLVSGTGTAGAVGTGTNQSSGLQSYLNQFSSLTSEQKQLLGLEETAAEKTQREGIESSLNRLITLQEQLAKAGAPPEGLTQLDEMIAEQQRALKNLTPGKFLNSQFGLKDVGISQQQLEREVATRREPIASALADLLTSRSIMAGQQEAQQKAIQGQIEGIGSQIQIRQALSQLGAKRTIPAGIQTELIKQTFGLGDRNTQVVNAGGRQILIDSRTGQTIRDLGLSPTGFSASSGGTSSGMIEAILSQPALFNTLTPTMRGQLLPSLVASGFTYLPKTSLDKIQTANATFNSADSLLGTIQDLSSKIITATSPMGVPLQSLSLNFGALFKTNADAAVYKDTINAFTSLLARAAGEKGVLTDQDVNRIKAALPKFNDTADIAAQKINQLSTIYQSIKDGAYQAYTQTPQTGSTQTISAAGATWRQNPDGSYTRIS